MNKKNFDQINSYSRLIVRELHDVIMHDKIYDPLKAVLMLAEELESYMLSIKQQEQAYQVRSNIIQFKRLA